MSEDEFRADLRWPTDPLGERPRADLSDDDAPPWSPPADLEDAGPGERALLDEVGRLSDRLLERMRGLRASLDADLAEIRTELAAVRQSLSKAGGRTPAAPPPPDLGPLVEEMASMRASVDGIAGTVTSDRLDDLADELAGLQAELVSLRRRITLRATAGEGASLTDEQLEQLAAAVAAHLRRDGRQGGR
jgi:hypothetical protein